MSSSFGGRRLVSCSSSDEMVSSICIRAEPNMLSVSSPCAAPSVMALLTAASWAMGTSSEPVMRSTSTSDRTPSESAATDRCRFTSRHANACRPAIGTSSTTSRRNESERGPKRPTRPVVGSGPCAVCTLRSLPGTTLCR